METWKKIGIASIGVLFLIFIFSGAMTDGGDSSASNTQPVAQEAKATTKPTQDDAEAYCQDANLLQKYVDLDKVSVVYASNYNDSFTEDIGEGVASFQWNGKDKETDESVQFVCDFSGGEDPKLVRLTVDGEQVF